MQQKPTFEQFKDQVYSWCVYVAIAVVWLGTGYLVYRSITGSWYGSESGLLGGIAVISTFFFALSSFVVAIVIRFALEDVIGRGLHRFYDWKYGDRPAVELPKPVDWREGAKYVEPELYGWSQKGDSDAEGNQQKQVQDR